jgi:hypothetical protein
MFELRAGGMDPRGYLVAQHLLNLGSRGWAAFTFDQIRVVKRLVQPIGTAGAISDLHKLLGRLPCLMIMLAQADILRNAASRSARRQI